MLASRFKLMMVFVGIVMVLSGEIVAALKVYKVFKAFRVFKARQALKVFRAFKAI